MNIVIFGSVVICTFAMGMSIAMMRRLRDWRIAFLTTMLGLIGLRQIITALSINYSWSRTFAVRELEVHGLVVSLLALFTVIFLQIIIYQHLDAQKELKRAHGELQAAYETLERAQASAIFTEKMAALGRLTAGACHEILNPLNIIKGRFHLLASDPKASPEMRQHIEVVDRQAERIYTITQGLVYFSRQSPTERQPVDLSEEVRQTLSLIESELRLQSIEVELELSDDLPVMLADKSQLQQVVLNLLSNARDAMPEGGRLKLRTEPIATNGEPFVELRIEDTGSGIAPENMDKLFDPFFTTKPVGEGTGLGLSVCQGIVAAHGGSIWAESRPGGGTTFVVKLPLEEAREVVFS